MIRIRTEIGDPTLLHNDDNVDSLNHQTQIISEFFSSFIKRLIVIELSDKVAKDYFLLALPPQKNAHCEAIIYFDFKSALTPGINRARYFTDFIYLQLTKIFEASGDDPQQLVRAYDLFKDLNYESIYLRRKLKSSPNRLYKAGIKVRMKTDGAKISVVYYKGKIETKEILIANLWPVFYFIGPIIYDGYWKNNSTFIVKNKTDEIHFETSRESQAVEISFHPNVSSLLKLQADLDIACFKTRVEIDDKYKHGRKA
jgi:hypothetical protein